MIWSGLPVPLLHDLQCALPQHPTSKTLAEAHVGLPSRSLGFRVYIHSGCHLWRSKDVCIHCAVTADQAVLLHCTCSAQLVSKQYCIWQGCVVSGLICLWLSVTIAWHRHYL